MVVFQILKIFSQISGVFPFIRQNKTFRVSKLYLISNLFIAMCLVIVAGIFVTDMVENRVPQKLVLTERYELYLPGDVMAKVIFFGNMAASLTAVLTKFIWRNKHVNNLNEILIFSCEHKLDSIFNCTVISDYYFIATLCISLLSKLTIPVINILTGYCTLCYLYSSAIELPAIADEIMLCVVYSALSKYQQAIRKKISDLAVPRKSEQIAKGSNCYAFKIAVGQIFSSQTEQFDVTKTQINYACDWNVSISARKLEHLRQINLRMFNIQYKYAALHQYQLFISTGVSIIEITSVTFILFVSVTQHVRIHSNFATWLAVRLIGTVTSNLARLLTLCYYTDKAFAEGVAIKYTVQEMASASQDQYFLRVSRVFMEQLHMRKPFQICGVFAFDRRLPVTFLGYAINYMVVLVQYLGFKL